MKEYKQPTVEVIEFYAADIITTSGPTSDTGSPIETEQSGNLFGSSGTLGSNGGAKCQ